MNPFKVQPWRKPVKKSKNRLDTSHVEIVKDCGVPVRYKCKVCHKVFGESSIKYHAYHGQQKPLVCGICGAGFISKSHFDYHHRRHSGVLPFECKTCGRKFAQKGNLTDHERLHSGELHGCHICNKKFNRRYNLTLHLRTHSGDKRYTCNECGIKFAAPATLWRHKSTHRAKDALCHICGKLFVNTFQLRDHLVLVHDRKRSHSCTECDLKFGSRKDALRHNASVHKVLKPFACKVCGSSFARKDNCRRHMMLKCKVEADDISSLMDVRPVEQSQVGGKEEDKNARESDEEEIDVVGV